MDNFFELKSIENISFNIKEGMVYILIKNEVYKKSNNNHSLIASNNERLSIPKNIDIGFLKDFNNSSEAINLISFYWSII